MLNYKNYGNLVSASIPNLICENMEKINQEYVSFPGFQWALHNAILFKAN